MAATTAPTATLDALDARLLDLVQEQVPLDSRPFRLLGERAGISEAECIARLRDLRDNRHVIRQISAIFDTKALGYESSLVAARYAPEKIEAAAAILSRHPGVSHNYERRNAFNLWYTLAVPPDSKLGLGGTIDRLHALSGARGHPALPTLRLFKIGVKLNVGAAAGSGGSGGPGVAAEAGTPGSGSRSPSKAFTEKDRATASGFKLSERDKAAIVVLQQNMELVPEPFAPWALQAGCTVEELIDAAKRFESRRQMRRFSAVLHHREAGFGANAMGVWRADPKDIDRVSAIMAASAEVSHCYLRPSYEDWPYNLYTMIHATNVQELEAVIERIAAATGITDHQALWSVREFKKVRVEYFTPAIAQWECENAAG